MTIALVMLEVTRFSPEVKDQTQLSVYCIITTRTNTFVRNNRSRTAIIVAAAFGFFGYLGRQDITPGARPWYLVGVAIFTYGILSRAGLFSILDLMGWLSNSRLEPAGQRHPTYVVLRPPEGIPSDRQEKIGVVLAGGGGKGAYQIGCWKTLIERGLKIDAVSGTSVGALNIAMLAGESISNAESVWGNLSASQLVRLDVGTIPLILLYLARWKRRYASPKQFSWLLLVLLTFVLVFIFGVGVWRFVNSGVFIDPQKPWSEYYSVVVTLPFLLVMISVLLSLVPLLWEQGPISRMSGLFHTAALRRLIESIVRPGVFSTSPRTYMATVAVETKLIDPNDGHQFVVGRGPDGNEQLNGVRPRIAYKPIYCNLGAIEREDESGLRRACNILQTSSALPYIFPAIRSGGHWLFDGGIADNVPITPLLKLECTRIFVLHLNKSGVDVVDGEKLNLLTEDGLLQKLQKVEYLDRSWHYYHQTYLHLISEGKYKMAADIWARGPIAWPRDIRLTAEIVHVVPSSDLGSFFSGTLNFTGRKARWLIKLGEVDMNHILDQLYGALPPADRVEDRNT